jgi:hypothetical protein
LDVPPGKVVELMASGDPAGTRERVTVAVMVWAGELASWTDTPKEKFPLPVGVPEIRPVLVFRLRPAGRLPDTKDQV